MGDFVEIDVGDENLYDVNEEEDLFLAVLPASGVLGGRPIIPSWIDCLGIDFVERHTLKVILSGLVPAECIHCKTIVKHNGKASRVESHLKIHCRPFKQIKTTVPKKNIRILST